MSKPRQKPEYSLAETRDWLHKQMQTAPRPLPVGTLPRILEKSLAEGFSRANLLDVLDDWLGYGYLTIVDQISHDALLTAAGQRFFYGD